MFSELPYLLVDFILVALNLSFSSINKILNHDQNKEFKLPV